MSAVERLSNYITRGVYTVWGPFHPFGGVVDIIVVQQPDGSFKSSPWYVKFGKFQGMLKTKKKIVNVSVNGVEAGFHMYLNHRGEAYFLKEVDGSEENSDFLSPSSSNRTDEQSHDGRSMKSEDLNLDNTWSDMATHVKESDGKMMARTNSRRSRIFGLMFGQKSMKDSNRLRKGSISMERISSLERAEIAAYLLETKWSTNLPTNNWKVKNDFKPSTPTPKNKEEENSKDVEVSDKRSPTTVTTDFDQISCLRSHEQVLVPPTLEATDFADSRKIISELPAQKINEVGEENASSDVMAMQSAFQASSLDWEDDPVIHSIHSDGFTRSNIEQASDRIDVPIKHYVHGEECGGRRVSSNHSGTLIRCGVGFDVYSEASETKDFSSGGYEEVHFSSEVLHGTSNPISKDNSEPESGMPMGTENLNGCTQQNLWLSRSKDYCCHKSNASNATEAVSENSLVKSTDEASSTGNVGQTITESFSSIDTCFLSLKSIENEKTELAQDETDEKFTREKILEMVATFENQFQMISPTNHLSGNEVINEKASNEPASSVQMDEDDITRDSTTSELGHLINQVQEVENPGEGVKTYELHLSSEIIIGPQQDSMISSPSELVNSIMQSSDSSEEQLPTSNIDNFGWVSADAVRMGSHPTEDIEEEKGLNVTYHEMSVSLSQSFGSRSFSTASSYPEELVQDSSPDTIEVFPEEVRTQSSPICIPRDQIHFRGVKQYGGSLPNIRSHIHDIEWCDVQQPLSQSLDVSSGNPNWGMLGDDFSSTSSTKAMLESHTVQDNPTTDVTAAVVILGTREHEGISTSPAIELSLCKHLLFEGMGAEAASQAFDAEKVDLSKFRNLGPSIVKNDSLIVRISGCYFPWDAAALIILGMASFGQEYILRPEGMIAVDQTEKTHISELSRTVAPSGDGLRLWPFRLKKTKIVNSSQPSPDATKGTDAENASEDSPDRSVNKPKASKKKVVRSIIPTSEQLASLNLKEGQNVITFTFSTAMLGRQQVDARIYLWKWNTRIVVSDVDGTITKSDVLGQFMPLVGRDWSQTGVAHLFSAIKGNGYELLFLSARAISQAYVTRQFLFNLKQDGKALPDGPVVISPDGLFPSFFREVIRRAPHEFKIACLEDIRALFPPDCNPFYAGFGNRDTDEISYLKTGIPKSKIFIINPKGEVVVNRRFNTKSYTSLHSLVNGMFPPTISAEQEDYNSWNYWKMPLPDIAI